MATTTPLKPAKSRKFDIVHMQQQLQTVGLHPVHVWSDPKQHFALILSQRS